MQNGTSLFAGHIYAIDAGPTIGNFRDAREIMNRCVGVPVVRIAGVYGEPSPLRIPTGNGQTGWNPDDADDDAGASEIGDRGNNSDGKNGHESGRSDHGHNSNRKDGHEVGHIHGVHSAVATTERAVMSKNTLTEAAGVKATMGIKLIKTILLNTKRMRRQGTSIKARSTGIRRT